MNNVNMVKLFLLIATTLLAIDSSSQTSQDFFARGNNKTILEDYIGAVEDFTKAIDLNPEFAAAYFNRGNSKSILGDLMGAVKDLGEALKLKPSYLIAHYNRGIAKYKLKDYRGAIADFTKELQINPLYVGAYVNRGGAKVKLKDYKGAISDLTIVIDKFSTYRKDAFYNRGLAKIYTGLKKDGCLDLSKAGELGDVQAYEKIKKYCN